MQQIIETRTTAQRSAQTSFATRLVHWVLEADRRHRERRALERLSNAQLDDIGKSRSDLGRMMREGNRG